MFQPSVNDEHSPAGIFTSATWSRVTVKGCTTGPHKIYERQQTCALLNSGISPTLEVIDSRCTCHRQSRSGRIIWIGAMMVIAVRSGWLRSSAQAGCPRLCSWVATGHESGLDAVGVLACTTTMTS